MKPPVLCILSLLMLSATSAGARTTIVMPSSPLHNYVLGRYATTDDELARAAKYFDAARAADPGQPLLARRTFDLALAAGDKSRAIALANMLATTDQSDSTVALVRLTDAILRRDWKAADTARAGLADAGFAAVVGPIVDAWTMFGRGRTDDALAKLDPSAFTGFARSYVSEQRAHMLAAAGRWTDAADAYRLLLAGTGGGINFLRVGQADALAMAGNKDAAAKVLAAGNDDGPVKAARERLAAGKRIGALAPDPRRGIGWLAARLASDLAREKPVALALVFARVGTFLAPDVAATWLICGDVLARSGQGEPALDAYAQVAAEDPLAASVRARRAEMLESVGRRDDAGTLLKAVAAGRDAKAEDWTRVGDWYRRGDRFTDAADAYGRALALLPPDDNGWTLYFLRGSVRERGGDWVNGEGDLREALKRSPDEPVVLNYLGYSLLDRGQRLDEASGLIERAAKLRPGDGGIIDSLGWSYFRQGRFPEAVEALERAAAIESTDPTVGEHLGDAYWRVGRRIEARFRWRAALDLDPSVQQRAVLLSKLDVGLDAALAMASSPR